MTARRDGRMPPGTRPLAICHAAAAVALPAGAQDLLIRAGHVLDVDTGRMLAGRDILVRDGRIVSIAPPTKAVDLRVRVLDWSALTVVPGLMDMHTHLADEGPYGDPATPLRSNVARDAFSALSNHSIWLRPR